MSLSSSNVEGEHIEGSGEVFFTVIDIAVIDSIVTNDGDTLEPVESHGVEKFIDVLEVILTSLDGSDDVVGLKLELLDLVVEELGHSSEWLSSYTRSSKV